MRYAAVLLAGLMACASPALGRDSSSPVAANTVADELVRESDRQWRISGEMARLMGDLGELVSDVRSNRVFSEAEGGVLVEMSDAIDETDEDHVRVAADELRKAVKSASRRASHIGTADVKIKAAVVELTNLLRRANALQLEDTIGQEIRDILREQQQAARQTAQAGREMLQELPRTIDPTQIARQQKSLAKRTEKLQRAMQEALKEELTENARERLQRAQKVAKKRQIKQRMQRAAEYLDEAEMLQAAAEQKAVIDALREMEDNISDAQKLPSQKDIEAMKAALEQQRDLRQKTEAKDAGEFKKDAAALQLDQMNLKEMVAKDSEAAARMDQAAKELAKMDQAAAVAAQKQAEAALMMAMKKAMGPGPGVKNAKGNAGTDDKGDGDGHKDKIGRGKGKGKGKGNKKGPPGKDDKPMPDGKPAERGEIKPMLAKNRPGRINRNPKAGERRFEKSPVMGKRPTDDKSTWVALSSEERDALSENFARELPREYRDMLKTYYEELSK